MFYAKKNCTTPWGSDPQVAFHCSTRFIVDELKKKEYTLRSIVWYIYFFRGDVLPIPVILTVIWSLFLWNNARMDVSTVMRCVTD